MNQRTHHRNSSVTENSNNEINTYGPEETYLTNSDQSESDINAYQREDEIIHEEPESPQRSPIRTKRQNKINTYQKPYHYQSSEETDSDDECIREKLRRKRSLKQRDNRSGDDSLQNSN